MRLKSTFLSALATLAFVPAILSAQVNEEFSDLEPYFEEARAVMARDRKVLIREALGLTPSEDQVFWTPYREYTEAMEEVNDLRVKVITDYAANADNFTDDVAKKVLKEWFDYEKERAKVKEKFASDFKKVIPEAKVARFYQIDNKLDAIINFALAMQIPLVEPR